jgi:hypothetical protein
MRAQTATKDSLVIIDEVSRTSDPAEAKLTVPSLDEVHPPMTVSGLPGLSASESLQGGASRIHAKPVVGTLRQRYTASAYLRRISMS